MNSASEITVGATVEQKRITPAKNGTSQEGRGSTLGARLDAMVTALSDAQDLANSSDLDVRVQVEFRQAIDHTRDTASVVQQWFDANAKSRDAYAVLPLLAARRVNHATQLVRDLSLDLENMDVTVETQGLQDLYEAIGQLHRQLGVLCKRVNQ